MLKQQIWLNSEIKIDKRIIYWDKWVKAGVIQIKNITKENGDFEDIKTLCERYKAKLPFTELEGIKKAIPNKWKRLLVEEEQNPETKDWVTVMSQKVSVVRIAYKALNQDENLLDPIMVKWNDGLQVISMSKKKLLTAIQNINKITNVPKLQSFQYRFLFKALTTNIHLQKYKIKSMNLCTFCSIEKETIEHVFFTCQKSNRLWVKIAEWLKVNTISFEQIVYNNINKNPKFVENMIVLAAKSYIYTARCEEKEPQLESFKIIVKNIKEIEQEIAKKNGKEMLHKIKWQKN